MNHTETPWVKTYEKNIIDAHGNLIARMEYGGWYLTNAEANAERIVACVNACEGMQDPAAEIAKLKARVAELEQGVKDAIAEMEVLSSQCELDGKTTTEDSSWEYGRSQGIDEAIEIITSKTNIQ